MSIKSYAIKHKLSMFNVIKMVKSGKLNTQTENIEGKEITHIVIDDTKRNELKESIAPFNRIEKEKMSLNEELMTLKKVVYSLRDEIEILKKRLLQ